MYELMGRVHAWLAQERGQGTVEYVGLILLLAAVLATVIGVGSKLDSKIAESIVTKLKDTITGLGGDTK